MKKINAALAEVLQRPDIWQASHAANEGSDSLPSGQAVLDSALHCGGWPRSAIIEILCDLPGCGEMSLLLPSLAHCSNDRRWLLFVDPPCLPYAPALQTADIAIDRLLVARPQNRGDLLWCAEQALRSNACSCLLAWLPERGLRYRDLRRLQLAARDSDSLVFFFRPTRAARELSPAALRLQLTPNQQSLAVDILKQRGGPAGQRLHLARRSELLANRIAAHRLPVPGRHITAPQPVRLQPLPVTPQPHLQLSP